ncbi:MAG: toll/interleukin-1 receptor domain-containing protein [Deltaproteobacteria bacterium]|nr:toll/interleukin-1 receptor domain-containing protein [Deltaproteobacteria bacterium]
MKRFDWVNQANRIDEIRYSLIFQFSRDSHKYLISDKLESEKIDSDKEVENVLSLNTLTREGNCKNNQVKLDKLSISKELPNKKETTKQSSTRKMTKDNLKVDFDIFICHASEDKKEVALPLAAHLQELGLSVWLDESELTLGDSLRQNIDRGLTRSRYGAVILSPAFFDKEWPNRELDGLLAREDGNEKIILPIWHNVNKHEVEQFSPILAGKVAVSTLRGIANVAEKIVNAVSR